MRILVLFLLFQLGTAMAGTVTLHAKRADPSQLGFDPALLSSGPGDTVALELPGGTWFQGVVRDTYAHESGNRTLFLDRARMYGEGSAMLTVGPEGVIDGYVSVPGGHFEIQTRPEGITARQKTRQPGLLTDDMALPAPRTRKARPDAKPARAARQAILQKAAGDPIRIFVAYTPDFAQSTTAAGLQAELDSYEAYTNQAMQTTAVEASVQISGSMELGYTPPEGLDLDLFHSMASQYNNAAYRPDYFAEAYDQAVAQGADQIAFLTSNANTGGNSGTALLFRDPAWSPAFNWLVLNRNGPEEVTFAHELGHRLGGLHSCDPDGCSATYVAPYAGAYEFSNGDGTILSTVHSEGGAILPRYSNPDQTCNGGEPCGDPQTADMARTINQIAPILAAAGDALSTVTFEPTPYNADVQMQASLSRGAQQGFTLDAQQTATHSYVVGGSWAVQLRQGGSVVKTFEAPFYYGHHTGDDPDLSGFQQAFYALRPGPDVAPGSGYTLYLKSNAVSPDLDVESDPFSITAPAPVAGNLQVEATGANYLTVSARSHGDGTPTTGTFAAVEQGGSATFRAADRAVDWKAVPLTYRATITGLPCNTSFDVDYSAASTQGVRVAGPVTAQTQACAGGAVPDSVNLSGQARPFSLDFTVTGNSPTSQATVRVDIAGHSVETDAGADELADGVALRIPDLACETTYQAQATVVSGEYAATSNVLSLTTDACDTGALGFAQTQATGTEGETVTLSVRRADGSAGQATVSYRTENGGSGTDSEGWPIGATAGEDFAQASGTLVWADGETGEKTIQIALTADNDDDEAQTENFTIVLSGPDSAVLDGERDKATVQIRNKPAPSGGAAGSGSQTGEDSGGGGSTGLTLLAGLAWLGHRHRNKKKLEV